MSFVSGCESKEAFLNVVSVWRVRSYVLWDYVGNGRSFGVVLERHLAW